jgi:hypothetical protein
MDEDIMKEVEGIMSEAKGNIDSEIVNEAKHHLTVIEETLWRDTGASKTYELYALDMVANSEQEVEALRTERADEFVSVDATTGDHKPNACLQMSLLINAEDCGAENIADLLANKDAAIFYGKPDNRIGYVYRTEAWGSETANETGKAPSECDDKYDITVTGMITPSAIATIVRKHHDNSVHVADAIPLDKFQMGEHGRVLDALYLMFVVPRTMKRVQPDLYQAAYEDVVERQETLSDNSNTDSK